jgi:putative NIF3 family GTP cyclohydrolase 1 type 2
MTTTHDVIATIEQLSGHPLNRDEGVHHGCADRPVSRALVCWMATPDALAAAGEQHSDLVIAHESLYYPYDAAVRSDNPPGWQDWPTNRQRRELLERYDLVLLRAHGSADDICIFDDFAALLGLGAPISAEGLAKVYEITPRTLGALVQEVKARTGMPAVRVTSPRGMGQVLRRVALPWGGLGLFVNVGYQQQVIVQGCDVLIAGEADNYGFRFCAELGIPMIETGHEISENPGLEHFAQLLRTQRPELDVVFYACPPAWDMH